MLIVQCLQMVVIIAHCSMFTYGSYYCSFVQCLHMVVITHCSNITGGSC